MENGKSRHKTIELFFYFVNRCMELQAQTKFDYFKILSDFADRKTIYKFLNELERQGALEFISGKNPHYMVNSQKFKEAFLSFPECKMANSIIMTLLDIAIDDDKILDKNENWKKLTTV